MSTINYQSIASGDARTTTINYQLSTINYQLSTDFIWIITNLMQRLRAQVANL
ncbi:MAG: hypothetical protein ACRC62_30260 [Microcoleus sp.]